MREIKFRAWQKYHHLILDVKEITFDKNGNISSILVEYPKKFAPRLVTYKKGDDKFPITALILMEYTGQKDKNKEEIWEGDIVKRETGEIYEVVWDDEAGRFLFVSKFKKYMEGYDLSISNLVEIIGNIYEY